MRTKHIEEGEAKCLAVCGEKYMKVIQRVGYRMQEFQAHNPDQGKSVWLVCSEYAIPV